MKIQDVTLFIKKSGSIVLGHKNKRDQLKSDYVDVTTEICDFFIRAMISQEGYHKEYNYNGKRYWIDCKEMTQEQIKQAEEDKKRRSDNASRSLNSLFQFALPFYHNAEIFNMFTEPVKLKNYHEKG